MSLERCVLYISTVDTASRSGAVIVNGKYRVPITLPKVKCLDELSDKYFPYDNHDPIIGKQLHEELAKIQESPLKNEKCTERELRFYELSKSGMNVKDIASAFVTSNDEVRMSIVKARIKTGEIPENRKVNDHNHVKNLIGRDLSDVERQVHRMSGKGLSNTQIGELIGMKRGSVSDALRRAKRKLGES